MWGKRPSLALPNTAGKGDAVNDRITPTQARGAARVQELLDACAAVIDEVGVERLTTNLVAERADCSIGTLYRYFPDRTAVLRALGLRHFDELHTRIQEVFRETEPDVAGYRTLLGRFGRGFVDWHKNTPGSSALGHGHLLDLPIEESEVLLIGGVLRVGEIPCRVTAQEIARYFVPGGAEYEQIAKDLEFTIMSTVALVDRASSARLIGADPDPLYEGARRSIDVTNVVMGLRYEQLMTGSTPQQVERLAELLLEPNPGD